MKSFRIRDLSTTPFQIVMYLEKPEPLTIWNGGSSDYLADSETKGVIVHHTFIVSAFHVINDTSLILSKLCLVLWSLLRRPSILHLVWNPTASTVVGLVFESVCLNLWLCQPQISNSEAFSGFCCLQQTKSLLGMEIGMINEKLEWY